MIIRTSTSAPPRVRWNEIKRMIKLQKTTNERLAVSVEDAAAMAGLGRTTIYAALSDGSLASLKIGKRRLIRIEALDVWMSAHEAERTKVA